MQIGIRVQDIEIDAAQRESLVRMVRLRLGRFGARVRRVELSAADLNGPKGGMDKRCHVRLELDRGGQMSADAEGTALELAASTALDRLRRILERRLSRLTSQRRRVDGGDA